MSNIGLKGDIFIDLVEREQVMFSEIISLRFNFVRDEFSREGVQLAEKSQLKFWSKNIPKLPKI